MKIQIKKGVTLEIDKEKLQINPPVSSLKLDMALDHLSINEEALRKLEYWIDDCIMDGLHEADKKIKECSVCAKEFKFNEFQYTKARSDFRMHPYYFCSKKCLNMSFEDESLSLDDNKDEKQWNQ